RKCPNSGPSAQMERFQATEASRRAIASKTTMDSGIVRPPPPSDGGSRIRKRPASWSASTMGAAGRPSRSDVAGGLAHERREVGDPREIRLEGGRLSHATPPARGPL